MIELLAVNDVASGLEVIQVDGLSLYYLFIELFGLFEIRRVCKLLASLVISLSNFGYLM